MDWGETSTEMTKAVRFAAFLPLMLILAACQLSNAAGPGPTASNADAESLATAPAPKGVQPVQGPAVADPTILVGLDGDGVTALLGQPGFSRRDGPAQVLQYSSTACVLDLFLYKKGSDAIHRVTHVELRGLGADETTTLACMRSLAAPTRRLDT